MSSIGKKLDEVIQLTAEEKLILFKSPRRTRFVSYVQQPSREYHIVTSQLEMDILIEVLFDAIKKLEFCLVQFPEHEKPPLNTFDNTLEAFLHRRQEDQSVYVLYVKENSKTLNSAKLFFEYKKCVSILIRLIDDLRKTRCYLIIHQNIKLMQELEEYLEKLDKDNINNIKLLHKREIDYFTLHRVKTKPTKQILELDCEYVKVQNEYHDVRLVKARELRYNKNLMNAQMEQIRRRENIKYGGMVDEINKLSQLSERELLVFEESSRYNSMVIQELKQKVAEMGEKYENDLINTEFEIARAQSELNYFEEMWAEKFKNLAYMQLECHKYIESVCQRKREAIAKRLGQPWIESARKTIADRKRRAKRLAKKNKGKKKM